MRTWVVPSLLLLVGCAHSGAVANEDRIDADQQQGELDEALIQGLLRLDCRSASGELTQARDESQSEGKRLAAYGRAVVVLDAMTNRYGTELARNPDLAYSSRAEQLAIAQRRCAEQLSLVKKERVRFEAGMAQAETSAAEVAEAAPAPRPAPVVKRLHHAPKKSRVARVHAKTRRHGVAVAQVE